MLIKMRSYQVISSILNDTRFIFVFLQLSRGFNVHSHGDRKAKEKILQHQMLQDLFN